MTDMTTNVETTETTETESTAATEDKSLITKGTDESKTETKTEEKTEGESEAPALAASDLTFPEGFEIDEAATGQFVDILNEGLSGKALADKLIALQTTMAQTASESISQAWTTMQDEWKAQAAAHPDFGGDKLAPALASVKELVNDVMGGEAATVFEALDLTGVGSHPALISLLHKLAVERAEGTATVGAPQPVAQSIADVMFPNQGQ